MPAKNKTVWAEKDNGAYEIDKASASEKKIQLVQHHKTGNEAFDARAVEVLLVKEMDALEMPVLGRFHAIDRRAIRMIDSGAEALALLGTDRHGIITGGLTEHDKTAGLLIAKEAGAAMTEYRLLYTPKEGDTQQASRHVIHVIAADEEMLTEMRRITERELIAAGKPFSGDRFLINGDKSYVGTLADNTCQIAA